MVFCKSHPHRFRFFHFAITFITVVRFAKTNKNLRLVRPLKTNESSFEIRVDRVNVLVDRVAVGLLSQNRGLETESVPLCIVDIPRRQSIRWYTLYYRLLPFLATARVFTVPLRDQIEKLWRSLAMLFDEIAVDYRRR